VPSDGVTGEAQFALYDSVKSAGVSVMPVAKCPLSRPPPPFRDFQRLHCGGIFESPVAVFDSFLSKIIRQNCEKNAAWLGIKGGV